MSNHQFFEDSVLPNYFLQPGYIFVPDQPYSISTVIGSGVSVCIYDRKKRIGGMNHFQFPHMADKNKTTPLYGNVATHALVKMMLARGARKKSLEAQIFGGAFQPGKNNSAVSRKNIQMAGKVLLKIQIPVISEDTGGEKGRKIVFHTHTNEAAVLKVNHLRSADWYPYQ